MSGKTLLVGLAAVAAVLLLRRPELIGLAPLFEDEAPADDAYSWDSDGQYVPEGETIFETIGQAMDEVIAAVAPGPVADMYASEELRVMLKSRERLRLERYNIGDGGWTIGYGHFEKNIANIPARITVDQANAMFDRDLAERAEKWVRMYVRVPLYQYQFDALVHIAFNMSPPSFKKFADTVNAGEGITYWANRSISWVAAHLQNGIRNRRNEELALFNGGMYA